MSLYQETGSGHWTLDVEVHGRRIKKTTSTGDKALARKYEQMVRTLPDMGRLDIIDAIKHGRISLLEVWQYYRMQQLDRAPTTAAMLKLDPTLIDWANGYQCSAAHRRNIALTFRHLLKVRPHATAEHLPELLRLFRHRCVDRPIFFNRTRSHVQAYLADTVGRSDGLWRAVQEIKPYPVRRKRRPGRTPAEITALAAKLRPADAEVLWGLVLTGMRPGEFWGRWVSMPDRIRVHGTKTHGSDREIPKVGVVVPPRVSRVSFRKRLAKVDPTFQPYDGRRAFAQFMELAGVPRTRRRLYLGHATGDVTSLYEDHAIMDYMLAEDTQRLEAFFGPTSEPTNGLRLVSAG
jgi:hypothetical protein